MKKLSLITSTLLLSTIASVAQVNVVPQIGLTTAYLGKNSYSAGFVGLVPAAAATDLFCITGSNAKLIKVARIRFSGTAGTLISIPVTFVRRNLADTGGTAATTTANPANTVSKRDTTNPTSVATLISYTANPTINDTSPTFISSSQLTLPTTAAGTVIVPLQFDYVDETPALIEQPTLRGPAQQFCINLNATTVTTGVLNGSITWTEE